MISAGFSRRFFGSEAVVGRSVPVDGKNYRIVGVVADVLIRTRTLAEVWVPLTTAPSEEWRTYKLTGDFKAAVLARRPADMERIRAEFATVMKQVEPPPDERSSHLIGVSALLLTTLEEWARESKPDWTEDYGEAGDPQQAAAARLRLWLLTLGGYMLLFMLLPALHLVQSQHRPHRGARLRNRSAQVVRRFDPHPGGAVRGGKRAAHPGGRGAQSAAQLGHTGAGFDGWRGLHGCSGIDPHLLLRGIARCVFRYGIRSLSSLENGASAPCPGVDREGKMIAHLCRLAWNRRRTNLLLVAELLLSFLVMTPMIAGWVLFAAKELKPLGFEYENVWSVSLSGDLFGEGGEQAREEYRRNIELLRQELQASDGVEAVALASEAPFRFSQLWNGIATSVYISDEGLETLGLRLLSGRWFQPEDEALDWTPAVIDHALSQALFGDEDPLGKAIGDSPVINVDPQDSYFPIPPSPDHVRVVGVVENCFYYKEYGNAEVPGFVFLRFSMNDWFVFPMQSWIYFLVKTYADTGPAFGEALRARIQAVVPAEQSVPFNVESLAERFEEDRFDSLTNLGFYRPDQRPDDAHGGPGTDRHDVAERAPAYPGDRHPAGGGGARRADLRTVSGRIGGAGDRGHCPGLCADGPVRAAGYGVGEPGAGLRGRLRYRSDGASRSICWCCCAASIRVGWPAGCVQPRHCTTNESDMGNTTSYRKENIVKLSPVIFALSFLHIWEPVSLQAGTQFGIPEYPQERRHLGFVLAQGPSRRAASRPVRVYEGSRSARRRDSRWIQGDKVVVVVWLYKWLQHNWPGCTKRIFCR